VVSPPPSDRRPSQSAKYEFASSNSTRTTFAFDACFVWELTPLADERNCFFHRISIVTIDAIEHVLNVASSWRTSVNTEIRSPFQE
jgi:hypothetical protein